MITPYAADERDQDDCCGRLSADPFFADIPVLLQKKGDITSDTEIAMNTLNAKTGKRGAVAIVLQPELVMAEPDAPGPEYFIILAVQVFVTRADNDDPITGTGKSAELICKRIRVLIHHYGPGDGTVYAFQRRSPLPVDEGNVSYSVTFQRRAVDQDWQPRCGLPLLDAALAGGNTLVTLTTATSGAAIYYTTDGSYPASTNPAATLYAAPFLVIAGNIILLRCAAELAGYQQSMVAQQAICLPDILSQIVANAGAVSNARIVTTGGAYWLQLYDTGTATWTTLWLVHGVLTTGFTTPGGVIAVRSNQGLLELYDQGDACWRAIWFDNGVLQVGPPDNAAADGAPAADFRWHAEGGGTFLQLEDEAGDVFRTLLLTHGAVGGGPAEA
jgi:hypothetical protein